MLRIRGDNKTLLNGSEGNAVRSNPKKGYELYRERAHEEIQNGKGISRGKSDSKPCSATEEAVMLTA